MKGGGSIGSRTLRPSQALFDHCPGPEGSGRTRRLPCWQQGSQDEAMPPHGPAVPG